MSLTQIKLKATAALEKIGRHNGTAPLESTDNRMPQAHELFIADTMRSYANKRYDIAKKEADKAGLLLDEEILPGSTKVTYENEHFSLSAKVSSPRTQISETKLRVELIKAVGETAADRIIEKSKQETKAPTSYIFAEK